VRELAIWKLVDLEAPPERIVRVEGEEWNALEAGGLESAFPIGVGIRLEPCVETH
jgi:hypothetical protein